MAVPGPGSGVTAPVDTETVVRSAPVPTVTSPELPLAVDTDPWGDAGTDAGQTMVAPVSRVSAGGWLVVCTGGCCANASTPTVASGITTPRALTTSSRGVRRRRTTSPARTRLPGVVIRGPRSGASAESRGVGRSCVVLVGPPARAECGHAQDQHDEQRQGLDREQAQAGHRAWSLDRPGVDRGLDPPGACGLALGPSLTEPVSGVEAGRHGAVVGLGQDQVPDAGRGEVVHDRRSRP